MPATARDGTSWPASIVGGDTATLLRWAARDADRTMLFGAAVQIQVPH